MKKYKINTLFIYLIYHVFLLSILLQNNAFATEATPIISEFEPNDTPQQALNFSAPAILSGSMTANDQDAYLWQISDADALKYWDITLHGIPEALTGVSIVRVKYGADPNVKDSTNTSVILGYEKLLTFGIRDGSRPVSKKNIFLPAGDYLVGFFQAGTQKGGFRPPDPSTMLDDIDINSDTNKTNDPIEEPNAYRLIITEGSETYFSTPVDHATQQTAVSLKPDSRYSTLSGGDTWYSIKIDQKNAQALWTIEGEIMLERQLTLTLYNTNKEKLGEATSNKIGHFTLPNLALTEGQYFIQLHDDNKKVCTRSLRIIETGAVSEGAEKEANDEWIHANLIDLSNPLTGKMDKEDDTDYFQFQLSEEDQANSFQLTLDAPDSSTIKFSLLNDKGEVKSYRSGKPPLILDTLNLNAGTYGLAVNREQGNGSYQVTKTVIGNVKPNVELEPNDQLSDASPFGKKKLIKGTLSEQDTDYFRLDTRQQPQLWRLQVIGKNLHDFSYLPLNGEGGARVRQSSGANRLRLDNLYLLPGTHHFALNASADTKYVIRAIPLGAPSPAVEREPNNSLTTAQIINIGSNRIGLLAESGDEDFYRFYLPAKQELQLELIVPTDDEHTLTLYLEGKTLKQFRSITKHFKRRLLLEPGDYNIRLSANKTSDIEYELKIKTLFDFAKKSDLEPNNNESMANSIPASWVLSGHVGDSYYSDDYYRIPKLKKALLIHLQRKNDSKPFIQILAENDKKITFTKRDTDTWQATLPADKETYFRVSGDGDYRYDISFESDEIIIKPPLSVLPLDMKITSVEGDASIAAYRNVYQNLSLVAQLTNPTTSDITANFEVDTTDDKWIATLETDRKVIPAGKTILIPISLLIKPDAWPDVPVTLRIIARDHLTNKASFSIYELNAKRFAVAKNSHYGFKPPKNLQGSINVAAAALGGKILTENVSSSLTNGMAIIGDYFSTNRISSTGIGKIQPIIQLAGDQVSEIIGFSFHPFGTQDEPYLWGYATKIKVELSTDGKQFNTALITKLSAHLQEQFFSLDKPILARYAKLTLLDSPSSENIVLGEFKVLANTKTLSSLHKDNIALPTLGGHVVWMNPTQPKHSYEVTLLTPEADVISNRVYIGDKHEWVIGFHHNRAAYIESIGWKDTKDSGTNRYVKTDIFISKNSPLGSWEKIGSWDLDGNLQTWKLDKPVWARFIKFVAQPHPDQQKGGNVNLPDQIIINEVQNDNTFSILGEWGHNSSQGPYELRHPLTVLNQENKQPTHTSKGKAKQLVSENTVVSQVQLGKYKNWYRVTIPEGQNALSVTLIGSSTVGVGVIPILLNQEEQEIPLLLVEKKQTTQVSEYEAHAPPGDYYLRIEEPPRSVILTWDTSASTDNVRPIIRQAVLKYIADVKPELDEAHMLPFGASFLSRRWLDQPYMLQTVLNDYNGSGNSSAAESALVQASEKLRNRLGKKIIVLITDAATTQDSALWKTLSDVRPRIIAIGVSSSGDFSSNPHNEQDLLQDWAMSSNGYYEYAESIGAVERAFDRASSKIRQPVEYQISLATSLKEPPKPGFLQVISIASDKKPDATVKLPTPTIEVILDASGSMFNPMGKQRRYQVARQVLTDLVKNTLPDNANFGLRVFGHKESRSCRTDLEIPIAPLKRKAAIKKINAITPKSFAKTPIADSLRAVANDLKLIKGEKILLLITDGEETCEGDPEKAIAELKEQGIDVVVNIIGFAINNDELDTKFRRWAQLGGGVYRQASNGDALQESLKELSARKFTVMRVDGEVIGSYRANSKPIELAVGEYQVDFGNELIKKITIKQNKTLILKAGK